MNSELDFWAGLVIGFVAAMNVGVVVLGLAHARGEINRENARKAAALIRQRQQASMHIPEKSAEQQSLGDLVREIHAERLATPQARRAAMKVVS